MIPTFSRRTLPFLVAMAVLSVSPAMGADDTRPGEASALPAASEDSGPRFAIERYQVENNTLLKAEDIERIVRPFTGRQKGFGDIQQALEALEFAYRSAGYSAVQVTLPEQKLESGVVRLRVIEARLKTVTVEGNRFYDLANVRRSLPALREGESPNAEAIAADLHVANENPVKQTQVVLRSGKEEGDVDALVSVTDDPPLKTFASFDNTGTEQTGRTRLGVGLQHANLFGRDHVFTAQYQTSPEKLGDVSIYGLGYHLPLYGRGASLDFFGGYSDVDSGVVSNLFAVSGKGTVLGARYNHHLPRIDSYQHKLVLGQDYRAYQTSVVLVGGSGSLVPDYTVHPLSLTYAGQWQMASANADAYITAVQNFPGGSKADDAALNASRMGADADYNLLRFGANFATQVAGDWQARAAFSGQYTDQPLVSGEQFGLGGAASVRGFQEREIADDYGYRMSFELYTPDFGARTGLDGTNLRALVFYDLGQVWRNNVQPGELSSQSIASFGAGLRFSRGKNISLALDFAQVIDAGAAQGRDDQMIHASISVVF